MAVLLFLGMFVQALLLSIALIHWGTIRDKRLRRLLAGLLATGSLTFMLITCSPFSHAGCPGNQYLLAAGSLCMAIALLPGKFRYLTSGVMAALGLANITMAWWLIGHGYVAWPQGQNRFNSAMRIEAGDKIEHLLQSAPPAMRGQYFNRGPVPPVLMTFLRMKSPTDFSIPLTEQIPERSWHTWLTGLYKLRIRPLAVLYPGGVLREVVGAPGRTSQYPGLQVVPVFKKPK